MCDNHNHMYLDNMQLLVLWFAGRTVFVAVKVWTLEYRIIRLVNYIHEDVTSCSNDDPFLT